MKQELLKLYKEYCDYIDLDDNQVTYHSDYKANLALFMLWIETGDIFN